MNNLYLNTLYLNNLYPKGHTLKGTSEKVTPLQGARTSNEARGHERAQEPFQGLKAGMQDGIFRGKKPEKIDLDKEDLSQEEIDRILFGK